ncbi:hypothetical protein TNCV_3168451 [Trichonephila clavipes]|nr:hypothetical protein TNCV_3168451 [Trichonephila clavipes]
MNIDNQSLLSYPDSSASYYEEKQDTLFAGLHTPENISEAKFYALKPRPLARRSSNSHAVHLQSSNFVVSSNRLLPDTGLRVPSNLEKTGDMPTQRDKPSNLGEKTGDMSTQRNKPSVSV